VTKGSVQKYKREKYSCNVLKIYNMGKRLGSINTGAIIKDIYGYGCHVAASYRSPTRESPMP